MKEEKLQKKKLKDFETVRQRLIEINEELANLCRQGYFSEYLLIKINEESIKALECLDVLLSIDCV